MQDNPETTAKSGKCLYQRVALPKDLHQQFKEKCADEGRVMGTVVAILVKRYLAGQIRL